MKKIAFALSFVLAAGCSPSVSVADEQVNTSLFIGSEEVIDHSPNPVSIATHSAVVERKDEIPLLTPVKEPVSQNMSTLTSTAEKEEDTVLSPLDIEEVVRQYKAEEVVDPIVSAPVVEQKGEKDLPVLVEDEEVIGQYHDDLSGVVANPFTDPQHTDTFKPKPYEEAVQQAGLDTSSVIPLSNFPVEQQEDIPRKIIQEPAAVLVSVAPKADKKDNILVTIEEAVRQYKADDFSAAVSNLDYATQLIRQKKSERMKSLLPEPFSGWQAKPATAQSLGIAVFGGGITVSRDYFIANGTSVSIEIVSDSPVLQSIIMMLNNPLFAGASGGNLKTIKRQRAIIKYDDKKQGGEINIVVAGRFIVSLEGHRINLATLIQYAEAVNFEALARN